MIPRMTSSATSADSSTAACAGPLQTSAGNFKKLRNTWEKSDHTSGQKICKKGKPVVADD